jgi:hypothetical protein
MPAIDYVNPFADYTRPRSLFARVSLQLAHRSLSLGLMLLVIGVGASAAGKSAAPLLLWAFASGDLAILGAFLSLASDRRRGLQGRESLVASALAGGVAAVSLVLFFIVRVRSA